MEKIILIDPGHGGLIDGVYQTPGKRATFNNITLYEGVLNRAVAYLLNFELSLRNIKSEVIVHTETDINLSGRSFYINEKVEQNPNKRYFLLSIHHNASDNPEAKGFECYTSKGETESDRYANDLTVYAKMLYPGRKVRHGVIEGTAKEADFYILKNTICPAVLSEFCFMTNETEFNYMTKGYGIRDEVTLLSHWIQFNVLKVE